MSNNTKVDYEPAMKALRAAEDRYRRRGIPYIKFGARGRYLRADVARYLAANRSEAR